MASNRTATLIVRAAARGLIDFSQARLLDRKWWLRLQILLDEIETADLIDLAKQAFMFHMLTAANGSLNEESFSAARTSANKLFKKVDKWLRPWVREEDDKNVLRSLYERYIGKFDDPAHKAAVDAEVANMKRQMQTAHRENEKMLRETADSTRFQKRLDKMKSRRRK